MPIPGYIEGDVHTLRTFDRRIDLVLQPVIGDLALQDLHIPAVPIAEIAAAPGNPESALRSACAKRSIRTAHRAAFSERNLVGLWLRLDGGGFLCNCLLLLLGLDFRVLALNLDRVGLFLFNLGLRLGDA